MRQKRLKKWNLEERFMQKSRIHQDWLYNNNKKCKLSTGLTYCQISWVSSYFVHDVKIVICLQDYYNWKGFQIYAVINLAKLFGESLIRKLYYLFYVGFTARQDESVIFHFILFFFLVYLKVWSAFPSCPAYIT